MVSYISVGELRRLQSLSQDGEELLLQPADALGTIGKLKERQLFASGTQKTFLKQKERMQLRSFRTFLRRERRFAAYQLKAAKAERSTERKVSSASSVDAADAVDDAAETPGSGQEAAAERLAADALAAGGSDTSSVSSSRSELEEEDDESVSGEEAERRRQKEKQDAEKHVREAQSKLRTELAYMREKIPEMLKRKHYTDAERLLGYYIQRFPRLPQLYFFAVQLYMDQRRYADAIDMCWAGLFCAPGNLPLTRSLAHAEGLLLQQVCRIPQKYKAALFNFSSSFVQAATREKEEREAVRLRLLGDSRFMVMKQNGRMRCIANSVLEPGDIVVKERPYVVTPMLLLEELLDPASCSGSSSSSPSQPPTASSASDAQANSSRKQLRMFTTCFHCLQERRTPDSGFACTESPYTCPFVFCSWECLMRNGRVHAKECGMLPFIFAAAKEAHLSPTSVLHFFRFLIRAGLDRDQGVAAIRAADPAVAAAATGGDGAAAAGGAGGGGTAATSQKQQQQQRLEQLDMLDRLFLLPSLRSSVEEGQPELYYRISLLMRRVQKELHARQYCFLKHGELVEAMLVLLQHSPTVVSGSAAAALSRRDPTAAVGLVFAGAAAVLPHSCVPTCCVDFSEAGGEVSVRAICNVPAGGSLCISMQPDLFEPTSSRKQLQALPCVFACCCSRCSDSTEDNRFLRGIRCSACNRGYCNPKISPALLLRLRAYGSGGPQNKEQFYWRKISNEKQSRISDFLIKQQRQWDVRPVGDRLAAAKEVQKEVEEEGERTGMRAANIRELLQQIDLGVAAAARLFADEDPYKLLAEVLSTHERQCRAAATAAAQEKAAARAPSGGGKETAAKITGGRRASDALSKGTVNVSGGISVSIVPSATAVSSSAPSGASVFSSPFSSPNLNSSVRAAEEAEETWQCSFCGGASSLLSAQCRAIEQRVSLLGAAAAAALQQGKPLSARLLLHLIIERYSVVLHPHNWQMYDALVVAAGLWLSQPQQQLDQALLCMRRATIAAAAVLPVCYREKVLLYTKMAELQFMHMQQQKLFNRAAAPPPAATVLEPLYAALHNAAVCCGINSPLALTCMQRIRIYAGALGMATPPLYFTLHLRPIPVFLLFYRNLFGQAAGPDEQIKRRVEEDPFHVAAAIARRGFCDDIAMDVLQSFKHMHHLPTGLSPVALAAAAAQVPLVKRMLQSGFGFLTANEWGVTPLLAMAACPLPAAPAVPPLTAPAPPASFSFNYFTRSSDAATVDSAQAAVLRLFLRACDERDAAAARPAAAAAAETAAALAAGRVPSSVPAAIKEQKPNAVATNMGGERRSASSTERSRPRGRITCRESLLQARTHRLLGLNGVLHLAAARGKKEFCKQLLRSGLSCFVANGEGATPLHLAALAADAATVQVLLDYSAASMQGQRDTSSTQAALTRLVNSRTERGETPLMLAAYGLQREVVSLLLERGADVNAIAHREQLTAFHALAVGICRDYEVQQQPLDLRGDAAAAVLVGLNDYSLSAGIYTRSNNTLLSPLLREQQLEDVVDLRIPLVSRLPADLLLFPQQLLLRLSEACGIVQLLLAAPCTCSTLRHITRSGYSAERLLLQLWQQLLHRRAQVLQRSEVRLASLSQTQRDEIERGWKKAGQLVFRLRELLIIAQAVAKTTEQQARVSEERGVSWYAGTAAGTEEAEEEVDETPRPEDIAYRRRKQLEREAPWVFYEERYKQEKQRAAAAAEVSKEAAAAPAEAKLPPGKAEGKEKPALGGAEAARKAATVAAAEGAAPAAPKKAPAAPAGPPRPPKLEGKAEAAAEIKKPEGKGPPAVPKKDSSAAADATPPKLPTPKSPAPPEGEKTGASLPKKPPAKGPPLKTKVVPPPPKKGP